MENAFNVKTAAFEGPLDLLLSLIEERKLLISDVSLSQVADDFLKYLETHVALPVGQAAHFVVIAATLLLIKSRALLPVLTLSEEEEGDVKDLEFRLSLYRIMRNAARGMGAVARRMFFGTGVEITEPLFMPSPDLSLAELRDAALRVLRSAPKAETREEVSVRSVVSLEEMIERLSARIQKAVAMSFREFSGDASDSRERIVGFLAVLELVKRGILLVEQRNSFGDITLHYGGAMNAPRFE